VTGQVFTYRHLTDEDAPGVSLSSQDARALAESALEQRGYRLSDLDFQDSQAQKRKAREDYVFVWQAKAGDPRNVGDAHYRLEVDLAGNEVVGFSRFFKLPEEWVRQRQVTRMTNVVLKGIGYLFGVGLFAGALFLFVRQVRGGLVPWRATIKVGATLACLLPFLSLNYLVTIEQQYPTAIPLSTFRVFIAVFFLVAALGVGLAGWVLVALAVSLYPDAWRIFRASARCVWRADAFVAITVSLAAGAALTHLRALVTNHFHALAPISIQMIPDSLDSFLPAAGAFLYALLLAVLRVAALSVVIYLVREAWAGKQDCVGIPHNSYHTLPPYQNGPYLEVPLTIAPIQLSTAKSRLIWLLAVLLLVALGPADAHSAAEFLLGWTLGLVSFLGAVAILFTFFRDNALAYLGAAFCLLVADPLLSLLSEPLAVYRWNGVLLAVLTLTVLAWMLVPNRQESGV